MESSLLACCTDRSSLLYSSLIEKDSRSSVDRRILDDDFFITYTSADRQWAEWIAFELAAGYQVIIQAGYFRPNSNCKT